jgi:predicted phosphohydrolase
MKKYCFVLILILFLSTINRVFPQQWSAEQKKVWTAIEAAWATSTSDKPLDFFNYLDESYFGWNYDYETPSTKVDIKKEHEYWSKKDKTVYYSITPARIWVNGNFAYVHYYFSVVYENSSGTPTGVKGRYTDILLKKEGQWLCVGDHGGKISR